MKIELPLRIVNSTNAREYYMTRSRRSRKERAQVALFVPKGTKLPCTVTLTRVAPRMFDNDGNVAAFKAIRDGIADKLGVNDNSPLVRWLYGQKQGKPRYYGVEIEIEEGTE